MSDSTTNLDNILETQSQKEVSANALFDAASPATLYGRRESTCTGLVWGYYGGRWGGSSIANGTQTLTDNTTTYMVVSRSTGAVSFSTSDANWNDTASYSRAYKITTVSAEVTSYEDHRAGPYGSQHAGGSSEFKALMFSADTDSTADSDTPVGGFKWNNATQSSATALYFDRTTLDGADASTLFASFSASGYIWIQQLTDATRWQVHKWAATPTAVAGSPSGYYKFTSTTLQAYSGSPIEDGETCICMFVSGGGITNWSEASNVAAPNNTVGATSFSALSSLSDADAIIAPKGTGAFLSSIPDSTTTGGNKRGLGAVDFQRSRSAANQVASGTGSLIGAGRNNRNTSNYGALVAGDSNVVTGTNAPFNGAGYGNTVSADLAVNCGGGGSGAGNSVGGTGAFNGAGELNTVNGTRAFCGAGASNTVSGSHAACPGGSGNIADGSYSVALGILANALGLHGVLALSSGRFGVGGYSQALEQVTRCETTNATRTTLTADQGAAGAANQLVLLNSSAFAVEGLVVARQNTTGDCKAWKFHGLIKRGANAAATSIVAMIGSPSGIVPEVIAQDAGAATWLLEVDADTTNGALRLRFTGEAGKTIRTTSTIRAVQTVL